MTRKDVTVDNWLLTIRPTEICYLCLLASFGSSVAVRRSTESIDIRAVPDTTLGIWKQSPQCVGAALVANMNCC